MFRLRSNEFSQYSSSGRNYIPRILKWIQLGQDIDGEANDDFSGFSVSLSSNGKIVAIGARGNDGNGSGSGHVTVYGFDGMSWTQLGADIDGEASGDNSGLSVSLSDDGKIVAIGANGNDGNGTDSGHVKVYGFDGMSWTQLGDDIDGEVTMDLSGTSVSLSSNGKIVAIGAPNNDGADGANGPDSGHVKVYGFDEMSWTQLGDDIDGEAMIDLSGASVSLSNDGEIVAIGARFNDDNGTNSGHVRVYKYEGTNWVQIGTDIVGVGVGDNSGFSVSLSSDGKIVAIGAPFNDDNGVDSGHVRVYEYVGTSWVQLGLDIIGEATNDRSGISVSLSSNGKIVAIGAPGNDDNGDSSGHVRVYEYDGTEWVQLGLDIDGEASGDVSGTSVSLSSNGKIVAIGAISNDDITGHVRVYEFR